MQVIPLEEPITLHHAGRQEQGKRGDWLVVAPDTNSPRANIVTRKQAQTAGRDSLPQVHEIQVREMPAGKVDSEE
jgi:hypothetical protein